MKAAKWLVQSFEHCRRFTNSWDYYCAAGDAFLAGYRAAREESGNPELGMQEADFVELRDGMHQLTPRTFAKQKDLNYSLPLSELLKTYLPMIDFNDVRVVEDEQGNISFQGTGKRVKIKSQLKDFVED